MNENLDLLVKLYDFKPDLSLFDTLNTREITIRRALAPELSIVQNWVCTNFNSHWADECTYALTNNLATCFIALKHEKILGFSCCGVIAPDFFGPTGVLPEARGLSIGTALLSTALIELKNRGYAYAVIGSAGPVKFYQKVCGAIPIPGSNPGIYKGLL